MPITIADLRAFAVARSLFPPVPLTRVFDRLPFVQADPIRAPARAQDLILRVRVTPYRAGDLERRYAELGIEEDVFINYGFVSTRLHDLMHPRLDPSEWPAARRKRAERVLAFVRSCGTVHPRQVDEHFAHGTVTNYWGGTSSATTHLLDAMQYRGLVRVVRRDRGVRVYAACDPRAPATGATAAQRIDSLIDVLMQIYGPMTGPGLSRIASRLRYAVPQWAGEVKEGIRRAKARFDRTRVDGSDWYWPAGERPDGGVVADRVRLLAPFDPVVWDRIRFEQLWGWAYRFEAYTPAARRTRGYYALPLLWRDRIIGWGNVSWSNGSMSADIGYIGQPPRSRAFRRALDAELDAMRVFLSGAVPP